MSGKLKSIYCLAAICFLGLGGSVYITSRHPHTETDLFYKELSKYNDQRQLEATVNGTKFTPLVKEPYRSKDSINQEVQYFRNQQAALRVKMKAEYPKLVEESQQLYKNIEAMNVQLAQVKLEPIPVKTPVTQAKEEMSAEEIQMIISNLSELRAQKQQAALRLETYTSDRVKQGKPVNKLWRKTDDELKKLILEMSIEEKAGQLLMFQAEGKTMTPEYSDLLKKTRPGGVIIMGSSIESPAQLKKFSGDIIQQTPSIPMLVSIDQEGGIVKRISWDTTEGASAWKGMSSDQICAQSKQRASLLAQAFINLNFAPVVDISRLQQAYINDRTISADPKVVSDKALAFINCSQKENVFATLKHFPGHGSTQEDSHFKLPVISKSKAEWLQTDAVPFKTLSSNTKFIMVGHLVYKNIDAKNPASQSSIFIDGILRKEFGYDSIVITDSMTMLHKSTNISTKEVLLKAYNSGIDIVLYVTTTQSPFPATPLQIHSELVQLIKTNQIPQEKVDTSLLRLFKVKRDIIYP